MGAPTSVPLFGNFSTLYMWYAYVTIGTPPVQFSVTVDTGSSDFFVPQAGCHGCDPPVGSQRFYNATESSTSTAVRCSADAGGLACANAGARCKPWAHCETNVTYGGSLIEEADVFRDVVTLGTTYGPDDPVVRNATFGGIYNISELELGAAPAPRRAHSIRQRVARARSGVAAGDGVDASPEGMLGLAFRSLVGAGYSPFLDTVLKGAGLPDVFSMCLTPEHGGMMTLGGLPQNAPTPQYTPIVLPVGDTEPDFYRVEMEGALVDGVLLPGIPKKAYNENCIVDTGTPMPTLPTVAYAKFKSMLLDRCDKTPLVGLCGAPTNETLFEQKCFTLTAEDVSAFPVLGFALKGNVTLNVPQTMLLRQGLYFCSDPSQYGLNLAFDQHFTVVGAPLLYKYLTVYDREQMRVGFADTDAADGFSCAHPNQAAA